LINQQVALKWVENKLLLNQCKAGSKKQFKDLLSGYELNNGITAIQSLTTQIIMQKKKWNADNQN
jgi:hypothetical protein